MVIFAIAAVAWLISQKNSTSTNIISDTALDQEYHLDIDQLRAQLDDAPHNRETLWLMAGQYHRMQNPAFALATLAKLKKYYRNTPAEIRIAEGRNLLALQHYRTALKNANIPLPSSAELHFLTALQKSRAATALGRIQTAEHAVAKAIDLQVDEQRAQAERARIYLLDERTDDAVEILHELSQRVTSRANIAFLSGEAARLNGKPNEAYQHYSDAIHKQPTHIGARMQRAKSLLLRNQAVDALKDLNIATQARPFDSDIEFMQAAAHYLLKRPDKALQAAEKTLDLDATRRDAKFVRTLAKCASHQDRDCRDGLQQHLISRPQSRTAKLGLALQEIRSGKEQNAIDLLQPWIQSNPSDQVARALLNKAYLLSGRIDIVAEDNEDTNNPIDIQGLLTGFYIDNPRLIIDEALQRIDLTYLLKTPDIVKTALSTYSPTSNFGEAIGSAPMPAYLKSRSENILKFWHSSGLNLETDAAIKGNPAFNERHQLSAMLAVAHAEKKKNKRANRILNQLRKTLPEEAALLNLQGAILQRLDDFDNAKLKFSLAASASPDDVHILLNLGRLALLMNDTESAQGHFHEALQQTPGHPEATVLTQGYKFFSAPQATAKLEKSYRHHPNNLQIARALVFQYLQNDQLSNASKIVNELIHLHPNNGAVQLIFGLVTAQQGRLDSAISTLKKAVVAGEVTGLAEFAYGTVLQATGKTKQAQHEFHKASTAFPNWAAPALANVTLEADNENFTLARELAQSLSKNWPKQGYSHLAFARIYSSEGALRKSLYSLKAAFDEKPTRALAIEISQTANLLSETDLANTILEFWLSLMPNDIKILLLLADNHLRHNRFTLAFEHYSYILELEPNHFEAKKYTAIMQSVSQPNMARSSLHQSLEHVKNDVDTLLTLARLELRNDNVAKAIEYLKQGLAFEPFNPETRHTLGEAYSAIGEKSSALQHFRQLQFDHPIYADKNHIADLIDLLQPRTQ